MCTDRRPEILKRSLELLFKCLTMANPNENLQKPLFKFVIKSILEDIDCFLESQREKDKDR